MFDYMYVRLLIERAQQRSLAPARLKYDTNYIYMYSRARGGAAGAHARTYGSRRWRW
eukprot:COSAG02_NODE_3577_length_6537_cov_17.172414_5_plen_57_part_00